MVAATTEETGIDQAYVYKDYFVCMALKEIVAANPALVFRGGTALSKCYGIIDRFSILLRCRNNSDYSDFSLIPRLWQSA
jgi:predicted nucleotidyltransferase component of viral defense system